MKKNIVAFAVIMSCVAGLTAYAKDRKISPQSMLSGQRISIGPAVYGEDELGRAHLGQMAHRNKIVSDAQAVFQQIQGLKTFITNLSNDINNIKKEAAAQIVDNTINEIKQELKACQDILSQ